jgi:hypothetical protein
MIDDPFQTLLGVTLTAVAVHNAPALSGLLNGLSLQVSALLDQALSDPARVDVRWIEGYNAWCARWAAAQSPGSPIG